MIRCVEKKDLERIAEIIVFSKRKTYRPIFNDDNTSFNELTVLKVYNSYLEDSALWMNMRIYDDGIIKGVINYKESVLENKCELTDFYCDSFFVQMGIGSALLEDLIKYLKYEVYKTLFLWVLEQNENAILFYEKRGFVKTGNKKIIGNTGIIDVEYVYDFGKKKF